MNEKNEERTCDPKFWGETYWAVDEPPAKDMGAGKYCSNMVINDESYEMEQNWQSGKCDTNDLHTGWLCSPRVRELAYDNFSI